MKRKLKLAFCLFKYFPFGGLQGDFLEIANICLERGHEIGVYVISWEGVRPEGFNVKIVPVSGFTNHKQYQSFGKKIAHYAKIKNYDAIIGFNRIPGLDIYYAADTSYAARMKKRSPLHRFTSRYQTFIKLEKAVYDKHLKTRILLLTPKEKQFYMDYYKTAEERFDILPPGISRKCIPPENVDKIRAKKRNELGIDHNKNIILMVCTNFKIKGVERAVKSIASLPQPMSQKSILVVVGIDNPGRYKRLARKMNISKQVVFTGARTDVPHLLMSSDLFLHPALIENTGTVIIEALVANLPVITTDICGYSHHVALANAGKVIPSPFVQARLNEELFYMLSSGKLDEWRNNAKNYISNADVFSRSQKAVDIIEKVAI